MSNTAAKTDPQPTYLVTGGAGFIGSNLVELLLAETDTKIVNLDLLTYAGRPESLYALGDNPHHLFVRGDIGDAVLVHQLLEEHRPTAIFHLAAETHVDRSIDQPDQFSITNLLGTAVLLRTCLEYWEKLPTDQQQEFRFLHVSTDEVYGALSDTDSPFSEQRRYQPTSPYAASKAGSDHLVQSFWRTYGLPTIVTNSTNNFGPRQLPEKLVPVVTLAALAEREIPIYGDGLQSRDWLYVTDQCRALVAVLQDGQPGESYNIGASVEKTNLEVVHAICDAVDALLPGRVEGQSRQLITHVADRPGHDRRYALNIDKLCKQTGWKPQTDWAAGVRNTVNWYADNPAWVSAASQSVDPTHRLGLRG